jgi:hypothetical protein
MLTMNRAAPGGRAQARGRLHARPATNRRPPKARLDSAGRFAFFTHGRFALAARDRAAGARATKQRPASV